MPSSYEYARVVHSVVTNALAPGDEPERTTTGYFSDGATTDYENQTDALAKLGTLGWELVTAMYAGVAYSVSVTLYFKRQID